MRSSVIDNFSITRGILVLLQHVTLGVARNGTSHFLVLFEFFLDDHLEVLLHLLLGEDGVMLAWQVAIDERLLKH